jgi:phospholipid/cholesterol/gamma-HCH transport system ATP-binding protein
MLLKFISPPYWIYKSKNKKDNLFILVPMIEIRDLKKSFGSKPVLTGVNIDIERGKSIVIIGRSGCGKSVLIKHIVGLLKPDSGYIKVEGMNINELTQKDLYKVREKFGFLFQGAALFDSMTVEENVALPLVESGRNLPYEEIKERVNKNLELVGLKGTNQQKPAELSGGMKKRVGLARALVSNPDYILYDEPTTGLDPIMSDSIDLLIKDLNNKLNVTSVVVTHDMYSVKNVADRVAMMHEGKIYFQGTPDELMNSNDQVIIDFIKRTGV